MNFRETVKAVAIVGSTLTSPVFADGKYDISYLWHSELDAVMEYRADVARVLGPDMAKQLSLVKGRQNYGLIWDRDANSQKAQELAGVHTALLQQADLDNAIVIPDQELQPIFNISFGVGPNLSVLKQNFRTVYEKLGNGVGKNLYIEEIRNGIYALVYKRQGEKHETANRARQLAQLLPSHISTSIIQESGNEVLYGESSFLHNQRQSTAEKARNTISPRIINEAQRSSPEFSLEAEIEKYIGRLRQRGIITPDMKTAWSVFDFRTGEKLVDINEDVEMQAASMIKPFVALAFFHEVHQGRFKYGPKSKRQLMKMIKDSDNNATNWFIDQMGGAAAVQRILTLHYGDIFQETSIVEKIPVGGRTYKNKASAHDYSRFLYALHNDQLPGSEEIKMAMAIPGRDRIYWRAKEVPKGTLVYNKTGSTSHLIGDMGILIAKDRKGREYPYTIIGIIESAARENYVQFQRRAGDAIRHVSNITFLYMKKKHEL